MDSVSSFSVSNREFSAIPVGASGTDLATASTVEMSTPLGICSADLSGVASVVLFTDDSARLSVGCSTKASVASSISILSPISARGRNIVSSRGVVIDFGCPSACSSGIDAVKDTSTIASGGFVIDRSVRIVSSETSAVTCGATSVVGSVLRATSDTAGSEKALLIGSASSSSRSIGSELSSRKGSPSDGSGTVADDRVASCAISAVSTLISLTTIVGGSVGDFAGVGEGETSPSSLSPSSPSSPSLPSSLPSSPS